MYRSTAAVFVTVSLARVMAQPSVAHAAAAPTCPWQYEHPAAVMTPVAVRSTAIGYTHRVEKLGVKAISPKADALKAPWWTVGEHRCKWQGRIAITYGGQLPKGVAVGYRVLVTTDGQMPSGGD